MVVLHTHIKYLSIVTGVIDMMLLTRVVVCCTISTEYPHCRDFAAENVDASPVMKSRKMLDERAYGKRTALRILRLLTKL